MRKAVFFAILVVFFLNWIIADAQEINNDNQRLPDKPKQEWTKRVWRIVDPLEKVNQPLNFLRTGNDSNINVTTLLLNAESKGNISVIYNGYSRSQSAYNHLR
jgi:hypothetical protein